MTGSPHPVPPDDSDKLLRDLVGLLARDAAPIDRALLARLRSESLAQFNLRANSSPNLRERTSMAAIRLLVTLAASLILAAGIYLGSPGESATALEQAIAKIHDAPSYRGQLQLGDQILEVVGQGPSDLRLSISPERYFVKDDLNLWQVDEQQNVARHLDSSQIEIPTSAARATEVTLGTSANTGMHPLALLGLDPATITLDQPRAPREQQPRILSGTARTLADQSLASFQISFEGDSVVPKTFQIVPRHAGEIPRIFTVELLQGKVDPQLLRVSDTLTADGRVGDVTDVIGVAWIKSAEATRWTPLTNLTLLFPGDMLRVDDQSRSAVAIALAGNSSLIAGPGTQLVLTSPTAITLTAGEIRTASGKRELTLTGPDQKATKLSGTDLLRASGKSLEALDKTPLWLSAYLGKRSDQLLGSLIANVDGRSISLDVGTHHVTIDIRDQIARTTIVESFINRTDAVLEGTFHFPLPADASISGFGMWIGDELVEADVVERQRAREIYETILREKRDPGLLEWTAGNQFQARVYPIPAKGEKRIKIVYTQVLPKHGQQIRYRYNLASELLQQNPLADLQITANIVSHLPLTKVASTTHPLRVSQSPLTARAEFSAANYRPTRDFELTIETAPQQSPLTLIPHRRGDDGYFLLLLSPPGGDAAWRRTEVASSAPLQLTLLVDTSASMRGEARRLQLQTVTALLRSLGPDDRVLLGAIDSSACWASDEPVVASEAEIEKLLRFISSRSALGWTNLDQGLATAIERSAASSHLIYLGDGLRTSAPHVDTGALAAKVQKQAASKQVVLHAISTSSLLDATLLEAITRGSGGSRREVTGEATPAQVAAELLTEITRPALQNLTLEISGIRTARVYPRQLPNLPAGAQQIVVGRYLPEGEKLAGEIIVRGTSAGKPVEFRQSVEVAAPASDASSDEASFLPRLWAKQHIDQLLLEGNSAEIVSEIIALSAEYHLITPYTSLLVLETEEDRARFKVKRTMQMKDGERFFADAQTKVREALRYQQMIAARAFRAQLMAQARTQLATPPTLADLRENLDQIYRSTGAAMIPSLWAGGSSWGFSDGYKDHLTTFDFITGQMLGRYGGMSMGGGGFGGGGIGGGFGGDPFGGEIDDNRRYVTDSLLSLNALKETENFFALGDTMSLGADVDGSALSVDLTDFGEQSLPAYVFMPGIGNFPGSGISGRGTTRSVPRLLLSEAKGQERGMLAATRSRSYVNAIHDPIGMIAGALPASPRKLSPSNEQPATWSQEAFQLAQQLSRSAQPQSLTESVAIRQTESRRDLSGTGFTLSSEQRILLSPKAWLVRQEGSDPETNYCTRDTRGYLWPMYQLHLSRAAAASDLEQPPVILTSELQAHLLHHYREFRAALAPADKPDHVWLELRDPLGDERHSVKLLVHTKRLTIVERWTKLDGTYRLATRFDKFTRVGQQWLATVEVTLDDEGREVVRRERTIELRTGEQFDADFAASMKLREGLLAIELPLRELRVNAPPMGKLTPSDRLAWIGTLIEHQRYSDATDQVQLLKNEPHADWICQLLMLQLASHNRDHRPTLALLEAMLKQLATQPHAGELRLMGELQQYARDILTTPQQQQLHELARPIVLRSPATSYHRYQWHETAAALEYELDNARGIQLYLNNVKQFPESTEAVLVAADRLHREGESLAAHEIITSAIERMQQLKRTSNLDQLFAKSWQIFVDDGAIAESAKLLEKWKKAVPEPSYSRVRIEYYVLLSMGQKEALDARLRAALAAAADHRQLTRAEEIELTHASSVIANNVGGFGSFNTPDNDGKYRFEDQVARALITQAGSESPRMALYDLTVSNQIREPVQSHIRQTILRNLLARCETLPIFEIQTLAEFLENFPAVIEDEQKVTEPIAERLLERLVADQSDRAKLALGEAILSLGLSDLQGKPILQLLIAKTTGPVRDEFHRQWIEQQRGSSELEKIYAILPELKNLSRAKTGTQQLVDQLQELDLVVERIEKQADTNDQQRIVRDPKLTRTQRSQQLQDAKIAARKKLRSELEKLADKRPLWNLQLQLKMAALEKQFGSDSAALVKNGWKLIGESREIAASIAADKKLAADEREALLLVSATLHQVAVQFTAQLVTADKQPAAAVDQLLAELREKPQPGEIDAATRRDLEYLTLLAADRSREVQQMLRALLADDPTSPRVRWELAQLQAEVGELSEAIATLQPLEAAQSLDESQLDQVARWRLALGEQVASQQTLLAKYRRTSSYDLSEQVKSELRNLPAGETVDERTLDKMRVVLEQPNSLRNIGDEIRRSYRQSRDFRLLSVLAESLIGRDQSDAIDQLIAFQSVLEDVYEEASTDEMVRYARELQTKHPATHDQRSLELWMMLAEARAAMVEGAAARHATQAMEHWTRAFPADQPIEHPEKVIRLLGVQTAASHAPLVDAWIATAERCLATEKLGTRERLSLAVDVADFLSRQDREEKGALLLAAELDAALAKNAGKPAKFMLTAIENLTEQEMNVGNFRSSETRAIKLLKDTAPSQLQDRLKLLLAQIYGRAVADAGETSLGRDGAQFQSALVYQTTELRQAIRQQERLEWYAALTSLLEAGLDLNLPGAEATALATLREVAPWVVERVHSNQDQPAERAVSIFADHHLVNPAIELGLLLLEKEPQFRQWQGTSIWDEIAGTMGSALEDSIAAAESGESKPGTKLRADLEKKLLATVLPRLRRYLRREPGEAHEFFDRDGRYYWATKQAEFLKVAQELAGESRDEAIILRCGSYVRDVLHLPAEAVSLLVNARERKLLSDSGSYTLADWLVEDRRYAEAVAILGAIIENKPTWFEPQWLWIRATALTGDVAGAKERFALLRKQVAAEKNRSQHHQDQLVRLAVEFGWSREAHELVAPLVAQRLTLTGGREDALLAEWYQLDAQALAELGQTQEAVEAAASAMVVAARDPAQQEATRKTLATVLEKCQDLPAYIAWLDKQTAASAQDRPILRQAIATELERRGEVQGAIAQLRIAIEFTPEDEALAQQLIDALRSAGESEQLREQLYSSLEIHPRKTLWWDELAELYQQSQDPQSADRARHSIADTAAGEADSYLAIGRALRAQKRSAEAVHCFERAVELAPKSREQLLEAARQLIELGQQQQAAAAIKTLRAIELSVEERQTLDAEIKKLEAVRIPMRAME